jgi:hypothetical protein
MTRCLAVAALSVMFAYPVPGQAAENGLSRNAVSLQDGITRNGTDRSIAAASDAIRSVSLGLELPR